MTATVATNAVTTARVLSYLGLLPFLGGSALAWATGGGIRLAAVQAVVVYAATILSFIGAIHWGRILAVPDTEPHPTAWLCWGVAPSLLGWGAVLLPHGLTVPVLLVTFVLAWAVDQRATKAGRLPGWYGRMRTPLTTLVCIALATLIPLSP